MDELRQENSPLGPRARSSRFAPTDFDFPEKGLGGCRPGEEERIHRLRLHPHDLVRHGREGAGWDRLLHLDRQGLAEGLGGGPHVANPEKFDGRNLDEGDGEAEIEERPEREV